MKRVLPVVIFIATIIMGCQVYNNSSRDRFTYRGGSSGSTALDQAMQIFTNKCSQCHFDFTTYTTDAEWISSNYVVAGDISASKAYYRLYGATVGPVGIPHDMPLNGTLTTAELDKIRIWIQNMTP